MAKDLLHEAIADAKAVREVALENAKLALSEAFDSKLKSMYSAKLSEEVDDETLNEYEDDDLGLDDEMDFDFDEFNFDDFPDEPLPGEDEEEDAFEDDMLPPPPSEIDIDNLMEEEDEDDLDEEIDLTGLLSELDEEEDEDDDKNVDENFDAYLNNLIAELEGDFLGEGDDEDEDDMNEARRKAKKAEEDKEKAEKKLQEAYSTIYSLKDTISEMNLLNSKLLYCNRIFKDNFLTQEQKLKVVETLDEAATPKEAKLIYSTITESFKIGKVKKRSIQENLGFASKPVNAKKVIVEQVDETVARMQRLANINPSN